MCPGRDSGLKLSRQYLEMLGELPCPQAAVTGAKVLVVGLVGLAPLPAANTELVHEVGSCALL